MKYQRYMLMLVLFGLALIAVIHRSTWSPATGPTGTRSRHVQLKEALKNLAEQEKINELPQNAVRAEVDLTEQQRRQRPLLTTNLTQAQCFQVCGSTEPDTPPGAITCRCSGNTWPGKLEWRQVPQLVMLTFNDHVFAGNFPYFRHLGLLDFEFLNPNGCPFTATFFVSDVSGQSKERARTDYNLVRMLYDRGHEVGAHGATHRWPQSWWREATLNLLRREFIGQRHRIFNRAGIPKPDLQGLRCPYLEMGGDALFWMMGQQGMLYDATVRTGPHDDGGVWPFKADQPFEQCLNANCPKFGQFLDSWEVPLNQLWASPGGAACPTADSCSAGAFPATEDAYYHFLWENFSRSYLGNKAPLNLALHAHVFQAKPYVLTAVRRFLRAMTSWDDVYVVSANQVISWANSPVPLSKLHDYEPWKRSCRHTY